ncbi:PulJ/GspJ family protein [Singulisphaera acidiphila]|uniref:Prepilin-type N-terminal cleavage/methylation domain-containing protein n=1 Tax=Singulisphaera acidiphila (strain ATCC BAA-1392 / DSM 18658 / VKM B-2454 / MOB10) TaxID=886293 RepID=L0DPC9_SINAD|nr:prepilin-type N-terminal cleavage/methylation domain-containing protein [Singulisphaera acidiphila]AGA30531.1 prepilin-type N-terminal cleavage/methylation domain-containing protein [Singulisphaera acidiphila DSM 18658]
MRNRLPRPQSPRRGVTLVEMLVAVALLVLMMSMIVTIFTSATGALSGVQTFQQLDGDLRQLDMTIRQDLTNITAKLTPPLNPNDQLGYFEVGENAFADLQNEDTDDYMRFTAKAPEGQPFKGRIWLGATTTSPNQPVLMTSQYAEIIYFLRNGNLYRRVLLIAPEKQTAVNTVWATWKATGATGVITFNPSILGGSISTSWQGVNNLSARPAASAVGATTAPFILNTLGDLTNRQNRFAYQRYGNDFTDNAGVAVAGGDGIPDDNNPDPNLTAPGNIVGDGVPDYPPTLYYGMPANSLLWEPTTADRGAGSKETLAFPYVFPGAYSVPDSIAGALGGSGWIHSLDPNPNPAFGSNPNNSDAEMLDQLKRLNHSPLESGDSLPAPAIATFVPGTQTWWGFPTWRETMLTSWTDPNIQVTSAYSQPFGLHPFYASSNPASTTNSTIMAANFLPPMTATYRATPQLFTDGAGTAPSSNALWLACWDDDLIMTGVRSFDIKVYDNSFPGYVDLGWGDDLRLQPVTAPPGANEKYLCQANGAQFLTETLPMVYWASGAYDTLTQTFAHEGRMPPLYDDVRMDAQFPNPFYPTPPYPYAPYKSYTGNVGDINKDVVRLRRVWDTWSTDYTQVPARGFNPTTKLPVGPPWSPPIYPSYPPPYPAPLRGLQIQIRVADPRGERVKTLTIRQDFSDKL